MSAPHSSSDNHELTRVWDEANVWVLRVHSGLLSAEEHREFEAWRARSPLHRLQFQDAERFWHTLDGLTGQVTREKHESPHGHFIPRRAHPLTSVLRSHWSAIAATFVVVLTATLLWSTLTVWLSDYKTAPGEQKSVSLADGSTVFLNTQSAFSVNLSEQRRSLALTRGEALFEVAHDIERPFEVTVGGWIVRAVGTTFNIDRHADNITVTVVEGAVRLLHDNDVWDIPVGYRIAYDEHHIIGELEPVDILKTIAWRKGEFSFTDMPLSRIVEELNRYRSGKIVIATASLGDLRLSGSLSLEDPIQALKMLQNVFPFQVTQFTSFLTIVS
ncbi:FecR family protein [Nitrospira sp. BLG_2]|uniref:FecR family protein n=1 Tax=Nitrospira sp. BLG_2 TaxID=3397507 RepID=UPI003B9A6F61